MGAVPAVVADWAAQRAFGPGQVPVGVATGVLGGGYLLWLLVEQAQDGPDMTRPAPPRPATSTHESTPSLRTTSAARTQ